MRRALILALAIALPPMAGRSGAAETILHISTRPR
jgi:hypothetical protein